MKKLFILFLVINYTSTIIAQVNLQTGSAVYSIPIFNWQDDRGFLTSNIAMQYNSQNGLKVNEIASNIGQGWNIVAGGSINRIQVGEPDDQKPYIDVSPERYSDIKKYPAGYLYSNVDPGLGVSSSVNQYPIFGSRNVLYKQHNDVAVDKELDIFAFNYNGKGGRFVLDKTTNQGVCLENQRIKIWFDRNENNAANGIRTTIVAFYLQDESGTIYKFNKYLKAKVLKQKYCNATNLTTALEQPKFEHGGVYHESLFEDALIVNPYIINEWQLTEVEDGFTHRKINLTYNLIRNLDVNVGTSITTYDETKSSFAGTIPKIYSIITHQISKTEVSDVATISYPDGHEVVFNYGQTRIDLPNALVLGSVDVKYKGRYISRHEFQTSYFILNRMGMPKTDYQKSVARLCLRSVKKIGPDLKMDENPYEFDYFMGSSLSGDYIPPPFTHLKDVWGYYNGDQSADFNNNVIPHQTKLSDLNSNQIFGLCFMRNGLSTLKLNPKSGYAKNGLLKQIIYPTGGAIQYEYVQNESVLPGSYTNLMVGGVHVSKTTVTDGGFSNGCGVNALVTNFSYTQASSNLSSLYTLELPNNKLVTSSFYHKEGKKFRWLSLKCKYKYQYPGILAREQAIDINWLQAFLESGVMDYVGLLSTGFDIVMLVVTHFSPAFVYAVIMDLVNIIWGIITTCTNRGTTQPATMYRNYDLNAINSLPSGFKRVEVKKGDGSIGKTVMEFTSPDDYPIWYASNPTYSSKQRYAYWAYGLPKTSTIYDVNNYPIKRTENTYDFLRYKYKSTSNTCTQSEAELLSCKYIVHINASKNSDQWTNSANYSLATYSSASNETRSVDVYGVTVGNAVLTQTVDKVFKKNSSSEFMSNTTQYIYDKTNTVLGIPGDLTSQRDYIPLLQTVKTIHSDGTVSAKTINYTHYQDKMVILPTRETFAKATNISSPLNNLKILETEYSIVSNGAIKPAKIKEARYSAPGGAMLPFVDVQTYTYSPDGILICTKDEGGRTVFDLYDYDNKYVVARIINAVPYSDKVAYTSFETSSYGGWMIGSTPLYVSGGVTGLQALNLTGNTLTATLNTSKSYTLSFWASSAPTVGGGAILTKSSPTINGFTYFEYTIEEFTPSITISGNVTIDEVRLLPQSARMTTATYDPVLGKTSEADVNSRVTYYEYDLLGRMRFVKNDYKNIVKMYEYNESKKGPCPVTYTNLAVSEIFIRNNCGAGYVGGAYIYTIPAGTYTSTYSQAHVDQMVEDALAANGQNAANLYGPCYLIYKNVAMSATFEKDECPIGYVSSPITYTVPAGTYSSIISQNDANHQAQEDIDANGQGYANTNGICVIDYNPQWESTGNEGCANGHKTEEYIDINPNSATYGQTQWIETDEPMACNPASCVEYNLTKEPGTNTNNLYIQFLDCGDILRTLRWDTQVILDQDFQTKICAKSAISFRYGTTGMFMVEVQGILVENVGQCTP